MQKHNQTFIIIQTTCKNPKTVQKISNKILENRLGACIQIHEISSKYIWKAKIESSKEYLLSIKTRKNLYNEVEQKILENQDYETPQVITIPIEKIEESYQKWLNRNIKNSTNNNIDF